MYPRKRGKYYKRKKQGPRNGNGQPYGTGFTDADKSILFKYLVEYRDGCERVCFSTEDCSDDETVVTAPARQANEEEERVLMIAGLNFPVLTDEVLGAPYLALPTSLNNKQRHCLHKMCVDVDLFHCGVGSKVEDRHVVISIHSDGFRPVPDLKPPKAMIPVRTCRPWFHRTDHPQADGLSNASIHAHVEEMTRQAKAKINALLDQPGECLRDGIDAIDFKEMDGQDLSQMDPPTGSNGDGSWVLVDTEKKMKQCAKELVDDHPCELGLDMEMYNLSKFTQVTCLIQLISSSSNKVYVIDTLAPGVWDHVSLLAPIFSDPTIVKVGHSIGSLDVRSLHRDFGIFVVNAFDTFEASQLLKLPSGYGLAKVCKHYGLVQVDEYTSLKEKYQRTDWRVRPLTDDMIRYGRYDVHYLLALRKLMIRDLTRSDLWDNVGSDKEAERRMIAKTLAAELRKMEREEDGIPESMSFDGERSMDLSMRSSLSDEAGYYTPPMEEDPKEDESRKSLFSAAELRMQPDLMRVISKSQQRCLDLWSFKTESVTKNDTFVEVIYRAGKGEIEWTNSHMELYEELVRWRNSVATKEQVLPGLVCPLDLLVLVALKRPTCEESVRRIQYYLPELLEDKQQDYLGQILSLVHSSLERDGLSHMIAAPRKYSAQRRSSQVRRVTLTLAAVGVVCLVAAVAVSMSRGRLKRR